MILWHLNRKTRLSCQLSAKKTNSLSLSFFVCVVRIEHHNLQLFISKSLIHHLIIEKTLKNIISRAFPSTVHLLSKQKPPLFKCKHATPHAHVLDSGDNFASGMLFLINICLFLLNFLILRWRYLICREIFLLFFWYYIKKNSGKKDIFEIAKMNGYKSRVWLVCVCGMVADKVQSMNVNQRPLW